MRSHFDLPLLLIYLSHDPEALPLRLDHILTLPLDHSADPNVTPWARWALPE